MSKNRLYDKINILILILAFTSCYPAPKVSGQFSAAEFDAMANKMAEGSTPDISVTQLVMNKEKYIILDSREQKEYDTSHIPNALWIGYDDFNIDRLNKISKNDKIVVYCSVGYRSERIGEKLIKAGFKDVSNLKGSIFDWVNEGYTIHDQSGEPTKKIHGYNKKWSKWLKAGNIVY